MSGVAAIAHVFHDVFHDSLHAIDSLDGITDAYERELQHISQLERCISSSLSYCPSSWYPDSITPCASPLSSYITRVIQNSNSLPPSLFIPEKAFHALVKEQVG